MSKIKQTATLIAITYTPVTSQYRKTEETYEYKVGEETVKFHAHPTKAWNWVILGGKQELATKVIKAACAACFESEALKTLKFA
ncbi:hypothetical protein D3C87_848030 [compost metagenome]